MKIFPLWLIAFCSFPLLVFGQGSLTPPPGAPGPTMKTLDQVEARTPLGQPIAPATLPITISSAGSYYLTGNVTAPSGYTGSGIVVSGSVSNVTIDLNGFTLTGVSGSGRGVLLSGGVSNVTIRNGTIRNWSSQGINGIGNRNTRVENIRAIGNGGGGISVDINGVVSNCVADGNALTGIVGTTGCLITHCQTSGTTGSPGNGIQVGTASVITDSISNGDVIGMQMANDAQLSNCRVMNPSGVSGFAFGNGCTFDGCAVTVSGSAQGFDGTHGLNPSTTPYSSNCVFRGCSTSDRFVAGVGSTFQNCSGGLFLAQKSPAEVSGTNASFANCTSTGGFSAGSGSTFSNCSYTGTAGTGFQTFDGSTLIGCTASGNGNNNTTGFDVSKGCLVSNCTATGFTTGFSFFGNNSLIANTAFNNTGYGFHGSGVGNRIDGNFALSNGTGIKSASATADLIVRNTSNGNNFQYDPSTGNNVGPTTGNPATSTSPWANF